MSFPVNSTSVETRRIARVIRVFQRHLLRASLVTNGGLYVCKETAGTSLFSAHSFGDAVDLMCYKGPEALESIAHALIRDREKRTVLNMMRRTEAYLIIWKGPNGPRQWTPSEGIKVYTGSSDHSTHVHVGCSPSVKSPKPLCAGGSPYLPGVAYVGR